MGGTRRLYTGCEFLEAPKAEHGGIKQMLPKELEPTEPWGELIEPWGPVSRNMQRHVFWVGALLFMCISEALVIHGLWFTPKRRFSTERLFFVPLFVLLPCLMGFATQIGIAKMSRTGQISLPAAASLKLGLGVLLMIAYMTILELAGIAFD
ncbi:MAG: hypothetical protein ABR898_02770 [Terracidiphilus sp.]